MNTYVFTLRYRCPDTAQGNHSDFPGIYSMTLTRTAATARQVLLAALGEMRALHPDWQLLEIAPDLLGLNGVAQLCGFSQKNMRQLLEKYSSLLPAPQLIDGAPFWHAVDMLGLITLLDWRAVPESELELAAAARQLNRSLPLLNR